MRLDEVPPEQAESCHALRRPYVRPCGCHVYDYDPQGTEKVTQFCWACEEANPDAPLFCWKCGVQMREQVVHVEAMPPEIPVAFDSPGMLCACGHRSFRWRHIEASKAARAAAVK